MAGWNFQVPTGRRVDTGGGGGGMPCFIGRESHQSYEISDGVANGQFPNWVWGLQVGD